MPEVALLMADELIRTETSAKRLRGYLGGHAVFDTTRPLLVWEVPYFPTYYVPLADLAAELKASGETRESRRSGIGTVYDLAVDDRVAAGAALVYATAPTEVLRDHVRIEWGALDSWFEEDEEVFTHARDPHSRVDVLPSSRHVRIAVDGVTIAESPRPTILFETGLPPRFYLPQTHVRMDLLQPTEKVTYCPYKGQARYWTLRLPAGTEHPDIAWSYRYPLPESIRVAGLVAFFDERVDVTVDGERRERPVSPFSRPRAASSGE